eukprot:SAG22_NODE_1810_length_3525_cov_13.151781_2_plen_228_part_00
MIHTVIVICMAMCAICVIQGRPPILGCTLPKAMEVHTTLRLVLDSILLLKFYGICNIITKMRSGTKSADPGYAVPRRNKILAIAKLLMIMISACSRRTGMRKLASAWASSSTQCSKVERTMAHGLLPPAADGYLQMLLAGQPGSEGQPRPAKPGTALVIQAAELKREARGSGRPPPPPPLAAPAAAAGGQTEDEAEGDWYLRMLLPEGARVTMHGAVAAVLPAARPK